MNEKVYTLIGFGLVLFPVICFYLGKSGLLKFKPVSLSDNYQLGWINRRIRSPRLGSFRDLTKMSPNASNAANEALKKTVRQPKTVVSSHTTKKSCREEQLRASLKKVNQQYGQILQKLADGPAVKPVSEPKTTKPNTDFIDQCVASLVNIGYKKGEVRGQVESFLTANPNIKDEAVFVTKFLKQVKG